LHGAGSRNATAAHFDSTLILAAFTTSGDFFNSAAMKA